jgi:osmotically-inducible protein OsmY
MANYNRHRGSDNTNYGNRDEERDRYSRKDYNQNQYGSDYDDRQDYDQRRDYGNTSSGSYNSDNDNRRWRRYDEDKDDYNRRTSNYGNRNYGNSYGSSQQNRDYDQNRYGNTGNYGSSSYGGSSAYGDLGYGNAGYGNDYNRYRGYNQNTNEDYGTGSYGYGYGYGRSYDRDRDYENRNRQGDRDWWDKTKDEVSSWFGDDEAERRRRMDKRMGAHRGRGPKGYTRSDERIREDINDRLSDDSFLDATEIDITVNNGEVTLTGTVENRIDKRRAEDLAEDISGLKNVQNQLR